MGMGHHSIHVVDCSSVVGFADLVDQIEVAVVVADLSFVDFADSVGVDLGFVVAVVLFVVYGWLVGCLFVYI